MGTERAIDGAFAAILRIIETCVEKFHLPDEAIVCLLMDKAQLVNEMQSKYNVQLDLSRAKNMCKITGYLFRTLVVLFPPNFCYYLSL